jgi:hypothetical protein
MSRGRLAASFNYRSKGLIDMSIRNELLRGFDIVQVSGASNVNTAYNAPKLMFEVRVGSSFQSPAIETTRVQPEESKRNNTRFVFDLGDYATTYVAGETRIPSDGESLFVRLRGRYKHNPATYSEWGPIIAVPPYDFFTTAHPVFTFTGNAPILASEPDTMGVGCMNVMLPYFSHTINITNLDPDQELFVTFHPGLNPTIIRPYSEVSLTGGGAPEIIVGCSPTATEGGDVGEVRFSVRMAMVNHS